MNISREGRWYGIFRYLCPIILMYAFTQGKATFAHLLMNVTFLAKEDSYGIGYAASHLSLFVKKKKRVKKLFWR